ncbi:MAG: hypothetical protein OXG06_02090 [Gammaproteobacteria bacterium]|nr:hypothetical protein [Gammaproteobacteria bacterium]
MDKSNLNNLDGELNALADFIVNFVGVSGLKIQMIQKLKSGLTKDVKGTDYEARLQYFIKQLEKL